MSNYAVMPIADYVGACDAIREKTESAELIKSGDMAGQIGAVYDAGQYAVVKDSEALKGSAYGSEALTINDLSIAKHPVGCKLESKNILDPAFHATSITHKGITVDYEGEGVYHIYGTATASGFSTRDRYILLPCDPTASYTETVEYLSGSTEIPLHVFFEVGATENTVTNWMNCQINASTAVGAVLTITRTPSAALSDAKYINGFWFYSTAASGSIDCRVRVQLEKGATATPYTPFMTDFSGVSVERHGKNLIPYPYYTTTLEKDGITYTVNSDGSVLVNGTAAENTSNFLLFGSTDYDKCLPIRKGNYIISGSSGSIRLAIGLRSDKTADRVIYNSYVNQPTFITVDNDTTRFDIVIVVDKGKTVENELVKPQLERGTTATTYEPYIEPVSYPATADGTVEGITSLYPSMTLISDTEGVSIVAEYIKDIDKAFDERLAELEAAVVNNA